MENYLFAPLILFCYNRPDHTRKILNNINSLSEAPKTKLFIFSDAAKEQNVEEAVDEVRMIIRTFLNSETTFLETNVYEAHINKGLANSIIEGVTSVIKKFKKAIILEDDLIVSKDFLKYMNNALNYYENNSSIWAISGYSFNMKCLASYQYDVFFTGRGCSWGWATWKNRWETVDWHVRDYDTFKYDIVKRFKFAIWGKDLPTMLDACMAGKNQSWAIRWCYAAYKQKKLTVYPVKSRINNNGMDGTGTNFKFTIDKYKTLLNKDDLNCQFIVPYIDYQIRKNFTRKYLSISKYFMLEIKWFLIKMGILKASV